MVRARVLSALLLLGVGGCGSSAAAPSDPNGDFGMCATDSRATPYQAGMSVMSTTGVFAVELLSSSPGPPVKGKNTWIVRVDEASTGSALDDLDVSVTPRMPDHPSHGTRPVVVTAAGAGTYALDPVYLYMSGVWEVRLTIVGSMVGAGTTDTAVIPICIP
jgi:hypothetical protein